MNKNYDQYTYRAGRKVQLRKSEDELVVRQTPDKLTADTAFQRLEQVSSSSTRIITSASQLESIMARCRNDAPTHHAYYGKNGDAAFLITDRIFSCFRQPPSDEELGEFLAKYSLVLLQTYSDRDFLFQLTNHTGVNRVKLVVELDDNDEQIESAEHDLNHQVHKYQIPSQPTREKWFTLKALQEGPCSVLRSRSRFGRRSRRMVLSPRHSIRQKDRRRPK